MEDMIEFPTELFDESPAAVAIDRKMLLFEEE